jgi:hypothetical protein
MALRTFVLGACILLAAILCGAHPSINYHRPLLSRAQAKPGSLPAPFTARDLITLLDKAGSAALSCSIAYQYGNPNRPPVVNEYAKVERENDWTAQHVAELVRHPNGQTRLFDKLASSVSQVNDLMIGARRAGIRRRLQITNLKAQLSAPRNLVLFT